MRLKHSLSRILLHLALIAGSILFVIPFFWLLSTSFKEEDEMFLDPPRWIPQAPAASPVSPYVERREFPPLRAPEEIDAATWASLQPVIVAAISDRITISVRERADPVDESALRQEMIEGLWLRLSERMPETSWSKPPEAAAAELVSYANDEMIRSVYESVVRKFLIGQIRFHSRTAEVEFPYEWKDAPTAWKSMDEKVAQVRPGGDEFRNAARVDYDLMNKKQFTLRAVIPCSFESSILKKIVFSHRADRSWFRVDVALEMDGRRFVNADPQYLARDAWQEVTWQFKSPDEKSVARKTWISLKEDTSVEAESANFNEPGHMRIDLTVRRSNRLGAYLNKFQSNYRASLNLIPLLLYTRNSVLLVVLNVAGQLIGCSLCAFAFARLRWPGRDFCFVLLLATLMLPGQVTMIPVFLIFVKLGWYNTLLPLWAPGFFGSAFFIFLLRQFMKSIPTDLEDSAKIDGCGYFRIYSEVFLPLLKPALASVAVFTFMGVWNDFMGPLIYITDQRLYPLSLGLFAIKVIAGGSLGIMMAASLVMTLPVIVLFFLAQRHFIQGITLTGIKG